MLQEMVEQNSSMADRKQRFDALKERELKVVTSEPQLDVAASYTTTLSNRVL